ncbi:hypothetical protein MML48_5g00012027 [Holotrichia oblita]|uniref:Uncharacterized protein n=1 Tax=Holotrichia oblita TaxID=644536 RepID=A0ACB9T4A2_HOLOL|nr:hypothetical protein MML48_5g00012027 [Holotrichia oblita]
MDPQHLGTATPSKSLLNTVHNKFAHGAFSSEHHFKQLGPHSTPPSRYTRIRNPFESHLADRLHTQFFSPSVFKVSSPKVNEKFQWTIEEISSFYPADIDETATDQYESHEHDSMMELTAQAKIDHFFSEGVAPSPFNQQLKSMPLISECDSETLPKDIKRTCDSAAQTILSLPMNLPEELENALKPYFNQGYHHEDIPDDNTSLHKKLFETEEIEGSVESSPPHSLVLSPIAPPNECDLESRFHSPFKLGDCNLSPIDVTNSPQREILSDSTVNWEMEYKHIAADTPYKKREMDVSNSNTPKSKIFTSQRKKLSDSFLKDDDFSDKENNISIDDFDIEEAVYVDKSEIQDTSDAGYQTGLLISSDISWCQDKNLFASTPSKTKK